MSSNRPPVRRPDRRRRRRTEDADDASLRASTYRRYATGSLERPARAARPSTDSPPSAGLAPNPTPPPAARSSRPWHRSGEASTATARTPARTDDWSGPHPHAGRPTARPSRPTPTALGLAPGTAEADVPQRSSRPGEPCWARPSWSRGTTGTPSARPVGAWMPASPAPAARDQRRVPRVAGRGSAPSGHPLRRASAGRSSLIPVAFTTGTGLEPDPATRAGWRIRPVWVFATYSDGGVGNLAGTPPRERARPGGGRPPDPPGVRRVPDVFRGLPRGDRRHPGLGRHRAGVAATLAG